MSSVTPATTTSPLAASELAYFHAGLFSREKGLIDAVGILGQEKKYDASELASAILAAALLDAERRGVVTLEVGKASRLFGLRKVDALLVKPGPGQDVSLPHTLEARVRPFVQARRDPPEARAVFEDMLQEDAPDPHLWAVKLVERGMAQRGLLETKETRTLKVFRSQAYVLPEATAGLARASSGAPVQELLGRTQRERPDAWRLLQTGLKAAFRARTESDGDDMPD